MAQLLIKEVPMNTKETQKQQEYWHGKKFAFINHRECEAFPCHTGVEPDDFNCLFCYCPLYALGEDCKGNFTYTPDGIKDCSNCNIPHHRNNYGYIIGRFSEIAELARKKQTN